MPRKPKTRAPYKMVSPPTWELARADYLNGMTAEAVAVKHGIGLANLRQTMARKGWERNHRDYSGTEIARFIVNLTRGDDFWRSAPWATHVFSENA